jgi:hypothetical protein
MKPQIPDDTRQKVFEFPGKSGFKNGKATALAI